MGDASHANDRILSQSEGATHGGDPWVSSQMIRSNVRGALWANSQRMRKRVRALLPGASQDQHQHRATTGRAGGRREVHGEDLRRVRQVRRRRVSVSAPAQRRRAVITARDLAAARSGPGKRKSNRVSRYITSALFPSLSIDLFDTDIVNAKGVSGCILHPKWLTVPSPQPYSCTQFRLTVLCATLQQKPTT